MKPLLRSLGITLITFSVLLCAYPQEKRAMGTSDIMKFRQVRSAAISNDGNWVVHSSVPDRGDPELFIYSSDSAMTANGCFPGVL